MLASLMHTWFIYIRNSLIKYFPGISTVWEDTCIFFRTAFLCYLNKSYDYCWIIMESYCIVSSVNPVMESVKLMDWIPERSNIRKNRIDRSLLKNDVSQFVMICCTSNSGKFQFEKNTYYIYSVKNKLNKSIDKTKKIKI